jgi:CO/xanthine dehydrogenase FAD-binding subunit
MPHTVEEACDMLAEDPARVPIAGGTDLLVDWPQRFDAHRRTYVDLWKLPGLGGIRWTDESLVLGGTVTYWEVLRESRVAQEFPLLARAASQVGAIQIQTRGTWAGNIANASPAADGVPVLMAYDAVVELVSRGAEQRVALSDFYLGYKRTRRRPDQLIRAVHLPRRTHAVEVFEKVGSRAAQSIAKVGVAVARSTAGWRVVASSMAPTVCRCASLERLLESAAALESPDDLLPAIRSDLSPIDDLRSTAVYRERVMARVLYSAVRPGIEGRF